MIVTVSLYPQYPGTPRTLRGGGEEEYNVSFFNLLNVSVYLGFEPDILSHINTKHTFPVNISCSSCRSLSSFFPFFSLSFSYSPYYPLTLHIILSSFSYYPFFSFLIIFFQFSFFFLIIHSLFLNYSPHYPFLLFRIFLLLFLLILLLNSHFSFFFFLNLSSFSLLSFISFSKQFFSSFSLSSYFSFSFDPFIVLLSLFVFFLLLNFPIILLLFSHYPSSFSLLSFLILLISLLVSLPLFTLIIFHINLLLFLFIILPHSSYSHSLSPFFLIFHLHPLLLNFLLLPSCVPVYYFKYVYHHISKKRSWESFLNFQLEYQEK